MSFWEDKDCFPSFSIWVEKWHYLFPLYFPPQSCTHFVEKRKKMQHKWVIPFWNQTLVDSGSPNKGVFVPLPGTGDNVWRNFWLSELGREATSTGQRPAVLLKHLSIHRTTSTTKNSPDPNVHTAAVQKPCCRVLCHILFTSS